MDTTATISPIGKNRFGNIYNQFKGKDKEAFDFLINHKSGYLIGVFNNKIIGDVDLVWGSAPTIFSGYGLSHIIKKHIETFADFESVDEARRIISDVILTGDVMDVANDPALTYIQKGTYRVVIARNPEGNWILTALDYVRPKKQKKHDKIEKEEDTAAVGTPGQSDDEAGAVAPNLPLS